ncbi:terminase large subunit [Vibrio phage vB_VpaM_sm033]|nr:terminase large subunit [Vibrio phage vB_VpaM_sm033]
MILYLSDWKKYPTAIVDYETKNTSFIDLAETYRKMGIVNCMFPLALIQPELQGVDPFSPDLTLHQKVMIANEAKYNPWYYLREIARVPVSGSPEPTMYLANRANVAMMWCFLNGFDYANIMPRQCGKSVGADVLNNWLIHIAGNNTVIQLFTHSNKLRNANVKRLKEIRDLLPEYLNFFVPGVDPDNQERIACKALGTEYLTSVAQKDKDAAHNAGRGLTSPCIQVDEGPFCPNIHISLPVALGSTGAARDWAKERGTFMGNIFTTTAGKRDSEEGGYMYDLIHDGMYWNERILDCHGKEAAEAFVRTNSKNKDLLMVNGTFSALQIGKTLAWLREKIANARGSREDAERDYLNIWTSGTDSSPLETYLLEIIRQSEKDPLHTEVSKEGYMLKWFIPQDEIPRRMNSTRLVMTIDSANMIGKDGNAMTIMDLKTMEVVATSNINEGSLYRYNDWIFRLLATYDRMTLIMENKSSAQGIFDAVAAKMMAMGMNPFRRMFNRIVNDRASNEKAYTELLNRERQGIITDDFYERYKKKFGFMTTGLSRHTLYGEVFQRAAKTTGHLISSEELSRQIRGLVMKNGRVDHEKGKHDDMVISWLMGHWFATSAVNLAFYGIEPGLVQSLVSEAGATVSKEELAHRKEQEAIMQQIAFLKDQLAETGNDLMKRAAELRIAKLAAKLDDSDQDKVMEELLNRTREQQAENQSLADAVRKRKQQKAVGWY